ncbi:polysaccharide deacetylase family protein [Paenibacillus filicis]|uniref:Polysaccharide deacetylase family protein n=1 Tax=Paenibacillus gyeongsangnamensis TaxID=3388067 RepID=A0ABT4QCT4_9BACL|nr:polysaccharide deacetylase family protein [Paenibacillus filicis]MCZ8514680.1 polysaccharide deacetylase family protein [Paenibacillus filicis]
MRIRYDRFPGGLSKAVTLSFDDGRVHDRRLVGLFNEYGLRGTFHLNSGNLGKKDYLEAGEIASLFEGHEISAHTVAHPFLEQSPPDRVVMEIMEDREALESLAGYPVRGMSYPYGTWNEAVAGMLPSLGIEYARTVKSTGKFDMPGNFLLWDPTCHHKMMVEHGERFLALEQRHTRMALLYVWGHSYEFENDGNWELVEQFGRIVGGRDDIWYATNAEITAYRRVLDRLRFSVSGRLVHNPSAMAVWVSAEGVPVEIPGGSVVRIG